MLEIYGIFTPGQALEKFSAKFLDKSICEKWVMEKLYPNGYQCPKCNAPLTTGHQEYAFQNFRRIKCKKCGKFFSAGAGTFLAGTHFDFTEIYLLALFLAMGMDNAMIANRMECTPETIRLWRLKFSKLA